MAQFDLDSLKSYGQDVRLEDGVIVRYPDLLTIGDHVAIDAFCHLAATIEIGSYIHIAPMVSISGGRGGKFVMRDFSGLAVGCRIICSSEDFLHGSGLSNPTVPAKYRNRLIISTVLMEKHSLLGAGCIVLPGLTIGEGAVAAAGSVVRKSMEPWTLYAGNPARPIAPRPKARILELEQKLRVDDENRGVGDEIERRPI